MVSLFLKTDISMSSALHPGTSALMTIALSFSATSIAGQALQPAKGVSNPLKKQSKRSSISWWNLVKPLFRVLRIGTSAMMHLHFFFRELLSY